MMVLRTATEMRAWSHGKRAAGKTIGLVPTMGAFHIGHESLMKAAIERDDVSIVSIFVNPAQFAPHEDFNKYPRAFEADCARAEALGVNVVYAPAALAMYPKNYATYIAVEGLQDRLCGISRPHFFRGVATVVAKLFNATVPDRAYFGQKDAQQCAIVKRMVRDLDFGLEIVELPIVREPGGLAMSSRNAYLTQAEHQQALRLSHSLEAGKALLENGERDPAKIIEAVQAGLDGLDVDYVDLVDAAEITPVEKIDQEILLAAAVKVGHTRLIDNIKYGKR